MKNEISDINSRLEKIENLIVSNRFDRTETLLCHIKECRNAINRYMDTKLHLEEQEIKQARESLCTEKQLFDQERKSFENERRKWGNLYECNEDYKHIYPSIYCDLNDRFFVSSSTYSERKMYLKFENCFEEFWENYPDEELGNLVKNFKKYSKDHPEKIQKNFKIKEENLLRIMRIGKRYELNIGQVISLAIYSCLYHSQQLRRSARVPQTNRR